MTFVGSWDARRSRMGKAVGSNDSTSSTSSGSTSSGSSRSASASASPNANGGGGAAAAGAAASDHYQGRLLSPQEVVASFEARPFQPAPLLRNEHWQTIWGARAIQDAVLQLLSPAAVPRAWSDVYDRRERWETPDADFFTVDYLFSTSASSSSSPPRPVAIVLHGLESTSSALLPRSMAKAYAKRGFDVVALNFRGCCGTDNAQPYAYHLGWTDDLKLYVRVYTYVYRWMYTRAAVDLTQEVQLT